MSLYPALYSSTASPSLFSQFSLIKHTSKDAVKQVLHLRIEKIWQS
ncbi:Uncharacterised protein [Vibrio cholerae]|nr:Uncharacterised protein [Vibrio cholerae]